jgi:lysophospholipase L1-like esterase
MRKSNLNVRWLKLAASIVSVVLVVILLATVEGATWIHHNHKMAGLPTYKPRHLNDLYRFYRVNPDYRSESVRVNTAGFRNDEEITREKPKNVVRVVMMGGSTVWGDDAHYPFSGIIDNRETIAAQLEAILNARAQEQKLGVKVQVLNAGVMGYQLFQNLIYFNHEIAGFHPDLVILMDGHNDLDAFKLGLKPYHHRNDSAMEESLNHPALLDVFRYFIKYSEGKSLFIRKTYSYLSELANRQGLRSTLKHFDQSATKTEMEDWMEEYVTTVRRVDASVRIAGARALFVVQLEALGEHYKVLTPEESKIQEQWSYYKWLHTVGRDRLIDRMLKARSQYDIWFEDVSDVTKGVTEQVYGDYTHLTPYGGKVVAERLAKTVESVIFSKAAHKVS